MLKLRFLGLNLWAVLSMCDIILLFGVRNRGDGGKGAVP